MQALFVTSPNHTFGAEQILKSSSRTTKRLPLSSQLPHMPMDNPKPKSFYRRKLPDGLTDLTTAGGKKLFQSALLEGNAEAFFPLISQLQTQSHPALCGIATLTVTLNALGIDPKRVWTSPWRWFADSLLDCCLDMNVVKSSGITLDELALTARCQGTALRVMRNLSLEQSRELIKKSVRPRQDGSFEFVIASYDRSALGQTGAGHFSPIAAYDSTSDSVLILDVARFKYGPHWVPVRDLVNATKPLDPKTNMSRGFMTIRKSKPGESDDCFSAACQLKEACPR